MITRADIDRELFGRMSALEKGRKTPKHTAPLAADVTPAFMEASDFIVMIEEFLTGADMPAQADTSEAKHSLSRQCVVLAAECLLLAYALKDTPNF